MALFQCRNDDGAGRSTHVKGIRSDEKWILHLRHRSNADPHHMGASRLRLQSRLRKERWCNIDDDQNVRLGLELGEKHLRLSLRIECRWPAYPQFDLAIQVFSRGVGAGQNFRAPLSGRQGKDNGDCDVVFACGFDRSIAYHKRCQKADD